MKTLIRIDIIFIMWRRRRQSLTPMQAIIILCAIFLGGGNTLASFIWMVVLGSIYYGLRHLINEENIDLGALQRRREAIKQAKIYLAPYKSIWKNLKLTNRYCYLELGEEASIINAVEKVHPYRRFSILATHVHPYDELWNMFCKCFHYHITYDGLKEKCERYRVSIKETLKEQPAEVKPKSALKPDIPVKKIDLNNASEIELTELPGISIVIAKKIIQKREEINGFKNLEQFFESINIKPHLQEQLKERIIINKKQGSLRIKKTSERSLDL